MPKLSTIYSGRALRIVTPCELSAFHGGPSESQAIHCDTALWDTGASVSVISSRVAAELRLSPTGMSFVSGFDGKKHKANTYRINIKLSEEMKVEFVEVVESPMITFDMLIGMDIIGQGDFTINNRGALKTGFSFEMD